MQTTQFYLHAMMFGLQQLNGGMEVQQLQTLQLVATLLVIVVQF